jgi:LacI family transcriptional regulator, galactose operon repressor
MAEPRPNRHGATLADVAEVAGVSPSTASRALNGRGELSAETRAAVLEAATALGFQPSVLARSLRTRRTQTIGFVVPDVASPFYAATLKGAQGALENAGYRVMLMDSGQDVDGEFAALQTLLNHQVDGLLLSTAGIPIARFEELVDRRGTPCVFFDSVLDGKGDGSVVLENVEGTRVLVEHLASHGHRRIALLAGSQEETSGTERLAAFRDAMRRLALPIQPELTHVCAWQQEAARQATHTLLELAEPPTAVVASSAELALGCIAATRERSLRLPNDLALVSFDDPYFGSLLDPPLTAVGYEPSDVGRAAAELLVDALAEPPAERERRELRIPVTLVRRESCGCGAT